MTGYHLVVCNVHLENQYGLYTNVQAEEVVPTEVEAPGGKGVLRPLQTAYHPCSVSSPNAQWTQRWD